MSNETSTGIYSTGDYSAGDYSTGNYSTGDYSTGNYSAGDYSTGDYSTGDWSTGDCSTGNYSTGNCSTGNYSTGNCSTGNCSTGNYSTGNCSTGNCSTGNYSTGNWSTGDYSVGHFATEWGAPAGMFNKPMTKEELENVCFPGWLYEVSPTKWVRSKDMNDAEKADHPSHTITGGYLKVIPMHEAWAKAWNGASQEDKEAMLKLPHWSNEVFKEISGIDVEAELNRGMKRTVTLELTDEQLAKVKEFID